MPLTVSWLVPSPALTAPVTEPALMVKVSLPVPELSDKTVPALPFIVRLLLPLPRSTLLESETPLVLPLTVSVSLPPWRSSCSKELKEKVPVEAASRMVPLLAPLIVTTSSVPVFVPRKMSDPFAPTRVSIPLNKSVPCPVLPPA